MSLGKWSGCVYVTICVFTMTVVFNCGSSEATSEGPRTKKTVSLLNNASRIVGENAVFTCSSPTRDCTGMTWYKDSQLSLQSNPQTVYNEPMGIYLKDKYIVAKSTAGCTLTVKNVKMEDAGSVSCQVLHSTQSLEQKAFLFVKNKQRKKSRLMGPENSLTAVGSDATFSCVFSSRDCAGMEWRKRVPGNSGETIYRSDVGLLNKYKNKDKYSVEKTKFNYGCTLTVKNVQKEDAMAYDCQIIIGSAQYSDTAFIIVIDA